MEKFKLDFSKPGEQEKFTKLSTTEKQEVVDIALGEAEIIKFLERYKNNGDIETLNIEIIKKQEAISNETMTKVQDIYQPHFATHASRRGIVNLFSISEDGLFSENFGEKYINKDIGKKRNLYSRRGAGGIRDQGRDRVSTFSVAPLIRTIEMISCDAMSCDVVPFKVVSNRDIPFSHYREKMLHDMRKCFNNPNLKINEIVVGDDRRGELVGNIKLSEPFNLNKGTLAINALVNLQESLSNRNMGFSGNLDEKKYPYLSSIINMLKDQFPNDPSSAGPDACIDFINKMNINLFKKELMAFFYQEHSKYKPFEILIDIDKLDDKLTNKALVSNVIWQESPDEHSVAMVFRQPEANISFDFSNELAVHKRISPRAFAGFVINTDKLTMEDNTLSKTDVINKIKEVIANINLSVAKRNFQDDEIEMIKTVQANSDMVSPDKLLLFATRMCNYNFLKEDFNEIDFIFSLANFKKLPVYDIDGNLIWPRKINHEKVANKEF